MNLNLRFFFPIVIRVHFWACAGCYGKVLEKQI